MTHDVFISYCTDDKPVADAACATLETHGTRCWIAPRDILPGTDWGEAIVDAIHESKAMLLVFSSRANASPQIKREVERAVNRGIPLIPVRVEDAMPSKSLEYFISTPHWLDALTPPLEQHLQRLAETVAILLQRMSGGSAPGAAKPAAAGPRAAEPPPRPKAAEPQATAFCMQCGKRRTGSDRFCTGCGHRFSA